MTDMTHVNGDGVCDISIIGAGPAGLFGAFYAGLRELKVEIVDALDEPGGQLAALYPEKFIYDVPGYPKIISRDLVKHTGGADHDVEAGDAAGRARAEADP